MSQSSLPLDWTNKFTDPYAVLGISVTADDRRVLKRYRDIAKLLHPDRYALDGGNEKELATQLLARIVNPAYEQLKQEKGRTESVALLRIKVRRLCREGPLTPQSDIAHQLMEHPASAVDVFYEQAIAQLADSQYQQFDQFEIVTDQLSELNLVYLQLKMGEVFFREKRTGLVASNEAKPLQFTPTSAAFETSVESYDQRHYRRAQEYAKKANWTQVVQELRDAIKIKADKSDYHALLGVAYLQQNLQGMARVHLRQALKLNPNDPLATRFAAKLGLGDAASTTQQTNSKKNIGELKQSNDPSPKRGGLFKLFRAKK